VALNAEINVHAHTTNYFNLDSIKRAMALILASGSPRRKALLEKAGYSFTIHAPDVEEMDDGYPEQVVHENALRKARAISLQFPNDTILAGDTIVVLEDQIIGKPRDKTHAIQILKKLSGSSHRVVSCIIASKRGKEWSRIVTTKVKFKPLDDFEIENYVETGEPLDKAGAYAIQGGAAAFVESYEGCYQNIVGFSIPAVRELLAELAD
jgi:septum formation protein